MDKPRNQHRQQIMAFIASDYFLPVVSVAGIIAVLIHVFGA